MVAAEAAHPRVRCMRAQEVFDTIHDDIRVLLNEIAAKGPLATYLESTPLLARFRGAAARLHDAIGRLPLRSLLGVPDETCEETEVLQSLLSRAKFELTPAHAGLQIIILL
ncbi:hypothetical protein FOA52_014434 [Chlamydomonas sp. UWO 241]|nr:hypothetical protein FOA52_014434 [Chlamydomonas sp. UWO 241]